MASRSAALTFGTVLLCASAIILVSGHGRLRSPPGRSTMWRDGFRTVKNYQDNELNCGGRWFQWGVHGGKCGVCGDPWGQPQENQPPGKYSRPFLAKCYQYGTRYIDAHVELTANHLGFMQFRLCPNNDFKKPVTQECLDQNLLDISNEKGKLIGKKVRIYSQAQDIFLKLSIPENLTCSQCVLQWRYVAGNSWGCAQTNGRRRCANGLGGQESFWACADIAIVPDCRNPRDDIPSGDRTRADKQEGSNNSRVGQAGADKQEGSNNSRGGQAGADKQEGSNNSQAGADGADSSNGRKTKAPASTSNGSTSGRSKSSDNSKKPKKDPFIEDLKEKMTRSPPKVFTRAPRPFLKCVAVGMWAGQPHMARWCGYNCITGFCPKTMCHCGN
ncbi:cell wall integrity and stress response component 4-like [Plakobranchus ocellatus]|uniref:Cell wall integrity and stress response component 4-like n=1 Tax=Plakobranchus ocellatus TaxID=259542 RepID=A0AAV4A380_9GAST|nr:cell wall integrity and stress response component 4-like [Plakobranchus ocellatus]